MIVSDILGRSSQNEWTNSYFDNLEFISEGGEAKFFRGNLKESVYRRLIRTEASRTMGIKVFRYGDAEHWRRARKHDNIIQIFAPYHHCNGQWGFVMEFMEMGSLYGIIYKSHLMYGMWQLLKWMEMILSGLTWLHNQGIILMDLNPKKILLGKSFNDLKLSSCFRLTRRDERLQSFRNQLYMAPEVIQQDHYGQRADTYSFAMTVWEIIYRRQPEKNFPEDRIDAELQYLLRRGWNNIPEERPELMEYFEYVSLHYDQYEVENSPYSPSDVSDQPRRENANENVYAALPPTRDLSPSAPTIDLDVPNTLPSRLNQLHELNTLKTWIVPVASILRPTPITNNESILMLLFGGTVNGAATDDVIGYDGSRHIWERWDRAKLPYPSQAHGVVLCKNQIYLIGGGQTEYCPVSSLYKWQHKWTRCQNMNLTRCNISRSCVVVNDNIYVIGGFGEGEPLSSVEKYDPNTNEWTWIESMNEPRSNASAGVVRSLIFVCGGYNGKRTLKSVECLNTKDRQPEWRKIECDMPGPRSEASLLIDGEYLILIGGYDGFNYHSTIWKYNTSKTKLWKCLTGFDMQIDRSDGYAAITNDSIFIVGGITTGRVIAHDFEVLTKDRHAFGPPLPLNLAASSVLVAKGH